jgi:hypothetical protein
LKNYSTVLLSKGDLVEIRTWRENDHVRVGVVMREIRDSLVSDFSRYEVLIDDKVVSVRRDLLRKVEKKSF